MKGTVIHISKHGNYIIQEAVSYFYELDIEFKSISVKYDDRFNYTRTTFEMGCIYDLNTVIEFSRKFNKFNIEFISFDDVTKSITKVWIRNGKYNVYEFHNTYCVTGCDRYSQLKKMYVM